MNDATSNLNFIIQYCLKQISFDNLRKIIDSDQVVLDFCSISFPLEKLHQFMSCALVIEPYEMGTKIYKIKGIYDEKTMRKRIDKYYEMYPNEENNCFWKIEERKLSNIQS